tara:strand:+ start:175 stop:393 length:219 start_codon:yes stop_codon:yes gene_type:complete
MKWAQIITIAIRVAPMIQAMSKDLDDLAARNASSPGGKKITGEEAAKIAMIAASAIGGLVDEILDELGLVVE